MFPEEPSSRLHSLNTRLQREREELMFTQRPPDGALLLTFSPSLQKVEGRLREELVKCGADGKCKVFVRMFFLLRLRQQSGS